MVLYTRDIDKSILKCLMLHQLKINEYIEHMGTVKSSLFFHILENCLDFSFDKNQVREVLIHRYEKNGQIFYQEALRALQVNPQTQKWQLRK